jgi:ATP-binding protein involved in chromosome partitioning
MTSENDILHVLNTLQDQGRGLVDSGMIAKVTVDKGEAVILMEIDPARGAVLEGLRQQVEAKALSLAGIKKVTAILTAEREAPQMSAGKAKGPIVTPSIQSIIAVASGKGGVGKSTIAANLAVGLGMLGLRVGLLDADIYGPSVPRLLGVASVTPDYAADSEGKKKLLPIEAHGIRMMSMGFLVAEESPMIWRGPMVQSALQQMLRDVAWGGLDCLVIDMPPGTGDIQLTLAQKVALDGAIIVSTPQDIALIDARKGLAMFRKVEVPVFGIVENMSFFCCPACGHRSEIFGHGGARDDAARLDCDFLGEIPLHARIRELSDAGTPVVIADSASPQGQAMMALAQSVAQKLGQEAMVRTPPRIVME